MTEALSLRGYCRTLSDGPRLQPGDDDHDVDDDREDRARDEEIGKRFHGCSSLLIPRTLRRQVLSGLGASVNSGASVLSTTTARPGRSLNTPVDDDLLARRGAVRRDDEVAAARAELHGLLAHDERSCPARRPRPPRSRRSSRPAAHARSRSPGSRARVPASARAGRSPRRTCPGRRRPSALRERRLNAHVSRRGVDVRIDGRDLAGELLARIGVRGHGDGQPFAQVAEPLLRQRELDVHGIERLQRHDGTALVEKVARR